MKKILWMLSVLPLAGCLQTQSTKPSDITLVRAMADVGEGLNAMRVAQGGVKTGLLVESAVVTFSISADSTATSGLKVDLAAPAISEGVGVHGDAGLTSVSKRSNVVTVTFRNILALPKDTVAQSTATISDDDKKTRLQSLVDDFEIVLQATERTSR